MSLLAGSERRARAVGAAAIVALVVAVGFTLVVAPSLHWSGQIRFEVHFDNVSALRAGAPVQVAGRVIGRVTAVALRPATETEDEPRAVALVSIDEARRSMVPLNGEFFVTARGVLSERYLEVGPPRDAASPGRPVADGDEVRGIDPPSMDRVLHRTWDNLRVTRDFARAVNPEFTALKLRLEEVERTLDESPGLSDEWRRLLQGTAELLAAGEQTWDDILGGGQGLDELRVALVAAREVSELASQRLSVVYGRGITLAATLNRVAAWMGGPRAEVVGKLEVALASLEESRRRIGPIADGIEQLLAMITDGRGTIGKLLRDPEFPEDTKELGKIIKREPWRVIGRPTPE